MAFDLKIPELPNPFTETQVWQAQLSVLPKLFSYALSFVVLAIMWLNQHAMFDKLPHTNSKLIWYNFFLLFAMSLIPMVTNFLAAHPFLPHAVMLYGFVMSLNSLGFLLLRHYIENGAKLLPRNRLAQRSNSIALGLYVSTMLFAYVSVYISFAVFIGIPIWYFVPEKLKD